MCPCTPCTTSGCAASPSACQPAPRATLRSPTGRRGCTSHVSAQAVVANDLDHARRRLEGGGCGEGAVGGADTTDTTATAADAGRAPCVWLEPAAARAGDRDERRRGHGGATSMPPPSIYALCTTTHRDGVRLLMRLSAAGPSCTTAVAETRLRRARRPLLQLKFAGAGDCVRAEAVAHRNACVARTLTFTHVSDGLSSLWLGFSGTGLRVTPATLAPTPARRWPICCSAARRGRRRRRTPRAVL